MPNKPPKHPSDELLLAYLDGELSTTNLRSIRHHLQVCWRCRASLHDLEDQIEKASRLAMKSTKQDEQRVASARQRLLRWIKLFESRRRSDCTCRTHRFADGWAVSG